jgi:hypothetical protein
MGFSRLPKEGDTRQVNMKAMAHHNFVGLAEFLRLARSLDSLEIHYYQLDTARFSFRRPTFSTWTPVRIGSLVFEASEIEAV